MKRAKSIHSKDYIDLISNLKMERKRLGLSQKDVAKKLKMQQSEISKIETNERRLDILEFKEILKIYNINENEKFQKLVFNFFIK